MQGALNATLRSVALTGGDGVTLGGERGRGRGTGWLSLPSGGSLLREAQV